MRDEMQEGWGSCFCCKKGYYANKIKYPYKDDSHNVTCPSCGAIVGWVPKGTDDYRLQSEESIMKQQKEDELKPDCPICQRKMVKRKGYSEFWGCINFPNCKGTREINDEKSDDDF